MNAPTFHALAAELVDEAHRGVVDVGYVTMALEGVYRRGLIDAACVVQKHVDTKCLCRCCADAGKEIIRLVGPQGRAAAEAIDQLRDTLARITP